MLSLLIQNPAPALVFSSVYGSDKKTTDFTCVLCNKAACLFLDCQEKDILHKQLHKAKPLSCLVPFFAAMQNVTSTASPETIQFTHADVTLHASIFMHEDQLVLTGMTCPSKTPSSEEIYHKLFHNAGDVTLILDAQGRILDANRIACERLDYTVEELRTHCVTQYVAKEDADALASFLHQTTHQGHNLFEATLLRRDGVLIPTEINARKLEHNNKSNIIAVARDTTDRKETEEQLTLAKELAETANKAKSEFLANMSHEIRTPLTSILGMLQLLGQMDLTDTQQEYLENATLASKSLLSIISDVLDISKVEAEKLEIVEEEFSPKTIINSVCGTCLERARKKNLNLVHDIGDSVPDRLIGDGSRIRQILLNLVSNAIKFTENGEVRLSMNSISRFSDTGTIRLLFSVSDTGIGIPENKLETIFDPFIQADSSYTKKHKGAGLGLRIVKQLVALMKGSLNVVSEEGIGSTFSFYVDLKRAIPVQEIPQTEHQSDTTPETQALHILYAEDNLINQLAIRQYLQLNGHMVDTVTSGVEALQALAEKNYDCVLMDIQMPEMDGLEAARRIRSSEAPTKNPRIPIIALTAYAMKGDKERFMEAGMTAYISKPIDWPQLVSVIQKAATTSTT